MKELNVKIKLDFRDFLRFQYYYLYKKHIKRLTVILSVAFLLPVFIGIILTGSFDLIFILNLYSSLLFLIPFFGIFFLIIYFSSKIHFQNDKQIQKEQHYIINPEGLQFSTENSYTNLSWDEVSSFEESKNNFLIFISLAKSYILPKRYLTENEIIFLKDITKNNIKMSKRNSLFNPQKKLTFIIMIIAVGVGVFSGLYKSKSEDHFENGYQKGQNGDYEGAILDFNMAIKEDNSNKQAYNFRGHAKGMLGDYTGEIEDCSKAIDLDKSYAYAYYNRASAKYFLADSAGACNDYNKALELNFYKAKEVIDQYCK
jgi:tetratricopeptide (TPR) repeat protein